MTLLASTRLAICQATSNPPLPSFPSHPLHQVLNLDVEMLPEKECLGWLSSFRQRLLFMLIAPLVVPRAAKVRRALGRAVAHPSSYHSSQPALATFGSPGDPS